MKSLSIAAVVVLASTASSALQVPFFVRESTTQITGQPEALYTEAIRQHVKGHHHERVKAKASWFSVPAWIKNAVGFPHRPPHPGPPPVIDLSDYTIAEILNNTLYSPKPNPHDGPPRWPPLRKLAFFVNISTSAEFKKSIADPEAKVTLFAPDDFALSREGHEGPPHHHHDDDHHHGPPHHGPPHHDHEHGPAQMQRHPFKNPRELAQLLQRDVQLMEEGGDDEEHKKRKEEILKIIGYILQYHLVDSGAYTGRDLVNNATIQPSLDYARIRIAPTLIPRPSLVLNFFSRTRGPTLKAKNGYIHLLSNPLLPPLTPLEGLFIVPSLFSDLTSAVQKVDLDTTLSPWIHHGADEVAEPVTDLLAEIVKEKIEFRNFTIFAPSNRAFFKLGPKINAFLFSPFGRRVLKSILEYHIVPDVVLFSDFVSDVSKVHPTEETVDAMPVSAEEDGLALEEFVEAGLLPHMPRPVHIPAPGEIKVKHYVVKTLFNDTSLPVDVYEARRFGRGPVRRSIWVGDGTSKLPGGRVQVSVSDAVAGKAAVHIIGTLIRPPFADHPPHHHEDHEHHEHHHHDSPERADRSFWQFARSLKPQTQKLGCHGKKRDVWSQLQPEA